MKKIVLFLTMCCAGILPLFGVEPSFAELQGMIRQSHPRLFINTDTLPAFKARLNDPYAERLMKLKKEVDGFPEKAELEYKTDIIDIVDGKMVFKRNIGDQNAVAYGLKRHGGSEALKCALVYLGTGDDKYLKKANDWLQLSIQFIELAKRSRILPEWYHYSRQCALMAYDWLHDELTDEQRKAFIVPMLEYVRYMQGAVGYQRNNGGIESGNYGEPGLMWFAGLAAWKDGYCDSLAEELLSKGYRQHCMMMNNRERMSAGTGLLMHITSGYVFGAYPWASCNFLHTLKSAANLDMTKHWTQMRDYPMFFSWMSIPNPKINDGFCEFGWGDGNHATNSMGVWLMYNHMAQVIQLFGDAFPEAARQARAVIELLPEKSRNFNDLTGHPYLPFILDKFDPAVKNDEPAAAVLSKNLAQHFPTFGLTVMRSGFSDGDTYASIKAGATVDQHQHYDENSFIIYKRGFQALDTGTRNNAPHHLLYYPQTVAHNAILIRMEDEPLPRHWYPSNAPRIAQMPNCDGGQNVRKMARSLGFEQSDYHVVTGGDATACYSAAKCREAVRQFVFIKPDYFVIYDRVTSVKPDQQKVFLLHSEGEPTLTERVWRSGINDGALFTKTLLPQENHVEVIGGPDKEFVAGGVNYPIDPTSWMAKTKSQTWLGKFRLEISPKSEGEKTRFLHLLQTADATVPSMVASRLVTTDTQDGVTFTTAEGLLCTVMFNRDGDIGGKITIQKDGKMLVERPLLKERPVGRTQDEAFLSDLTKASRMDVFMPDGSLQLVDEGNTGRLERPQWLNYGDSFVAQFKADTAGREGRFTIRAVRDGKLVVKLMGPDIREGGVIQKYMVEYSAFSVNGKSYLPEPVTVWHNTPRIVEIPVKAGEELKLEAKFHALGKQ